jgi:hypothetical protein
MCDGSQVPLKRVCGYIAMPVGIGWIVRARGIAPSLGAGGTIIVAGLCCLVFVSSLLTFRSWPSGGGSGADGSLLVQVPEAKAAGRSAEQPAPATAPGRARKGGAPVRRVRFRGSQPRPATPAPAATRPTAPAPSASPAAPTRSASSTSPPASQPSPAESPVVPVPSVPPGAVENTVGTVGGVVDDVTRPLPPAPPVVAQPVQETLDTVQGVAQTVDDVTGPLLP